MRHSPAGAERGPYPMTQTPEKPIGTAGMKIVRRTLADGTVKEYRYDRRQRQPARIGFLRRLFNEYSVSPEFKRAGPAWQARRLWLFNLIELQLGWMTRENLEARSARGKFYGLRDKHAHLPSRADAMMSALRSALTWAYDRGIIGYNHALNMHTLVDTSQSPHADKCLTFEQEQDILGMSAALVDAYQLAVLTGLRRTDCTHLEAAHIVRFSGVPGEWLDVVPRKTARKKIRVLLPIDDLPPLRALVDRLRQAHPAGVLLRNPAGEAWNDMSLSRSWRWACDEVGLVGWRFHDIRHTANTRLAEAGCTEVERAAVMGRKLTRGSETGYIARTRELAVHAYRKYWAWLKAHQRPIGEVVSLENALRKTAKLLR